LDKTFEEQKELVNSTIVPTVMKTLDKDTFPIVDGVVYKILRSRHHHQREEFLKKGRSDNYKDKQDRRCHVNSRRSDVSNKSIYVYLILFDKFYYSEI